jgi:hypothetical protein
MDIKYPTREMFSNYKESFEVALISWFNKCPYRWKSKIVENR